MASEIFNQLVDAHYTPLFRFALSLTRNSSDAGDLTQQTFFIWAKQGHALREASKAKSWLFTTLYRDRLDIPWGQPLYQLAMIKTADRPSDDPSSSGG